MKQDKISEQWPQIKDQVKAEWGKLTEQDLNVAKADSQYLCNKLEERYGEDPAQARQEVQDFARRLS